MDRTCAFETVDSGSITGWVNPKIIKIGIHSFCLIRCVALMFENLLTSSSYFYELNNLDLNGLAIYAESLRKDFINKASLAKQMGKDQLNDLELDGPIALRIVDGIAWDFTQAKWWTWWKTMKCGGLILSCYSAALTEKRAMKKKLFTTSPLEVRLYSIRNSVKPSPCVVRYASGQFIAWLNDQKLPSLTPGQGYLVNKMQLQFLYITKIIV